MIKKEKIIVTGCAGFIGMHLCVGLLRKGYEVLGLDNLNQYYSLKLKEDRLKEIKKYDNFKFKKIDISDYKLLNKAFKTFQPQKVVNLAAQAGVRYSIKNPHSYISSNIVGFMNILECVRYNNVEGLIYASSSSVYGKNEKLPYSISDSVDNPISIYAASKKSNELMAHAYRHLYNINTTGLRFFTVYGPWGRPDMAMHTFADRIINDQKISVFNHGDMYRDFTYVDDIIKGLISSIEKNYSYEIFNLGNSQTINVLNMIKILETELNKKAKIEFLDIQLGDVKKTHADIEYSVEKLNFNPTTSIDKGISKFIKWFVKYYE